MSNAPSGERPVTAVVYLEEVRADQDRSVPATSAAQAALFLRRLDPKAKMHCFQTFYERKDSNRSDLTRVIHSKDLSEVTALHDQGAAVFTCVNRTDGLGRKNENITHVRAVWCEADTTIQRHFPLPPSLEVQTSPGHYHYYWLVQGDDWPADQQGCADHSGVMERMVRDHDSDNGAKGLNRVLRVPGFLHRKTDQPHLVKLTGGDGRRYSRAQILEAFPPIGREERTATVPPINGANGSDRTYQQNTSTLFNYDERPSYNKVADALHHIKNNASVSYQDWINIGFAVHDAGLGDAGRCLFEEWSSTYPDYVAMDTSPKWPSFARGTHLPNGHKVTHRTLFWKAREHGWRPRPEHVGDGLAGITGLSGKGWPFQGAKDFRCDFRKDHIVKNLIIGGEVSNWCGLPGTGKSSVFGDVALHVTARRTWRGHRVNRGGAVIYFALERLDLVKRRFNAQAAQYGLDPKLLPFYVVGVTIDMMTPHCVQSFLDTIAEVEKQCEEKVVMLVIDTSAKAIAAGNGEENSAKDKNTLRANARRVIENIPTLHVALIGHTGKDVERGERGSNAGLGDDDLFVFLNGASAVIKKRNDGPEGLLTPYRIIPVKVGVDEDGEQIDIGIVDPDPTAAGQPVEPEPEVKLTDQAELVRRSLINAINDHGVPAPDSLGLPRGIRVVSRNEWRDRCKRDGLAMGGEDNSFYRAFTRAAEVLLKRSLAGADGQYVWPVL